MALKEAINAGRDRATRIAIDTYTAPAKKLRRETRINKNPYMEEIILRIYGGLGVSLMNYAPIPNTTKEHPASGVTAHVRRAGSRHPWKSKRGGSKSFVAPKNNGGLGIFVNHGVKKVKTVPGKRPGKTRKLYTYDLEMLYGPSPIQAVLKHEKQEEVGEVIEQVFVDRMNGRMSDILEKIAAGIK